MKRTVWLSLAASFAVSAVLAQDAGQMITFKSGAETTSGYLSLPKGGGKKPAVVVIQEWWGLNDFVKKKADYFASQGYVALAPDLYRGKLATTSDEAHQYMMALDPERGLADLRAAVATLRARSDVDAARIASVGWCMGGAYSLRLALAEPKLAGAVVYYGRPVTDEKQIAALQVPILGHFGGQDQGPPPEMVQEFETKAKAAGKVVDLKFYPEAGHGFASNPQAMRADDAKDADKRTDRFFEAVLKGKKG
jgi:carboxymethylenebutenolidase